MYVIPLKWIILFFSEMLKNTSPFNQLHAISGDPVLGDQVWPCHLNIFFVKYRKQQTWFLRIFRNNFSTTSKISRQKLCMDQYGQTRSPAVGTLAISSNTCLDHCLKRHCKLRSVTKKTIENSLYNSQNFNKTLIYQPICIVYWAYWSVAVSPDR